VRRRSTSASISDSSEEPICIFFAADELQYHGREQTGRSSGVSAMGRAGPYLTILMRRKGWSSRDSWNRRQSAFAAATIFDTSLYWLRGTLVKGEYQESPLLRGIFPNTTWAVQQRRSGTRSSAQATESPTGILILQVSGTRRRRSEGKGGPIRRGTANAYRGLRQEVIVERLGATGEATETWVLWREVPDFFGSSPRAGTIPSTLRQARSASATGLME